MKHVICLDGGGAKGLFTSGIVSFIAQAQAEKPLSKVFDLITGVSVGAWIGSLIAFGFLDNPLDRARIIQSISLELGDTFREKNVLGPLLAPKYSGNGKFDTLKRLFGDKLTLGQSKVPLVILCCTLGGAERIFCSWNENDKNFLLIDILNATSAVPVYFPPIKVGNQMLVDGGLIQNIPLPLAFLKARELFGKKENSFNIFSVGTHNICELKIEPIDINMMGLITWMNMGLFDIAIGAANQIPILQMEDLLEDNFMRISCNCGSLTTDSLDATSMGIINNAIQYTWTHQGSKILKFLN